MSWSVDVPDQRVEFVVRLSRGGLEQRVPGGPGLNHWQ
jgi:hypothetical protein